MSLRYTPGMSNLDGDTIRHALKTAREYGFQTVRIELEGSRFQATLSASNEASPEEFESMGTVGQLELTAPGTEDVQAPVVGYWGGDELAVGQTVKKGDVLGIVTALGLPNEVASPADGEIIHIAVRPGEAVEYGQAVATLRRAE